MRAWLECPLGADCVAKLFAALRESNNRIRLKDILNQCCALAFVLESILLFLAVKIVSQHNLPTSDIARIICSNKRPNLKLAADQVIKGIAASTTKDETDNSKVQEQRDLRAVYGPEITSW
jgi:hypothetical protein